MWSFQKAKATFRKTAARRPYPDCMKGGRMQVVGHTKTDMTACRMRHGIVKIRINKCFNHKNAGKNKNMAKKETDSQIFLVTLYQIQKLSVSYEQEF